jgi:hypothetical protein
MKIEKAIELLTKAYNYPMNCINTELHDATKLGIEALKRVKADRNLPYPVISDPLPGETKEYQR